MIRHLLVLGLWGALAWPGLAFARDPETRTDAWERSLEVPGLRGKRVQMQTELRVAVTQGPTQAKASVWVLGKDGTSRVLDSGPPSFWRNHFNLDHEARSLKH